MHEVRSKDKANLLLGIDLGGTKIAATALTNSGAVRSEIRVASPRDRYDETLKAIRDLTNEIAKTVGLDQSHPVGIGTPGSTDPNSGLLQNSNSIWLNGRPIHADLEACLNRPVKIANDANCFALSEACDGAGQGMKSVFGVIVGTGCGGGLVINGEIINGARGIAGEWGHTPLPWANTEETPGPPCWCGQKSCMETWISGPALEAEYRRKSGIHLKVEEIVVKAENDLCAQTVLANHANRLARGLASIVNLFDPDVIILGGGLSAMTHLYEDVPELMAPYIFSRDKTVNLKPPKFGDASGVRGAARLWSDQSDEQW